MSYVAQTSLRGCIAGFVSVAFTRYVSFIRRDGIVIQKRCSEAIYVE